MNSGEVKVIDFSVDIFENHDIVGFKIDGSEAVLKIKERKPLDTKSVFEILDGIFKPVPQINFG